MSMFNDISCDSKDNKDECLANAGVVKVLARRFGIGQWSFIGPGSEKKWYSSENSPQGARDNIAEQMLLEFAESGHPTFRATTPLSRGILKSKGRGKLSIHFAADVKSTSPDTENHDRNGDGFQDNNKNFIMTNVDNSDTTYTNKNDTNNHNAHDLHK